MNFGSKGPLVVNETRHVNFEFLLITVRLIWCSRLVKPFYAKIVIIKPRNKIKNENKAFLLT